MNDTTREWFTKAEADRRTAERELAPPESPNFDAVCLHAQQCVETDHEGDPAGMASRSAPAS